MLDPDDHSSVGGLLQAATTRWSGHTCLIEANRDGENARLTYTQFAEAAAPVAAALQEAGLGAGGRVAIIMTNQSRWLVGAYAVFASGGVLVPLDYKLEAAEHARLLAHCRARLLIIEYHLWRALAGAAGFSELDLDLVLVSEAPPNAELHGARRFEHCAGQGRFVERRREDLACIVYSSGTGGRPKGCMLTHDNYLAQYKSLATLFPFWPGMRYLSILPTNHAIDFMVGFLGPFACGATVVHLRTLRPEYVKEAFKRYEIAYVAVVPMVLKNLEQALRARFGALSAAKRWLLSGAIALNRALTRGRPRPRLSRRLLGAVHREFGGRLEAMFVGGAFTEPRTLQFFYDLGIPVANGYGLTEAGTALTLNTLRPFRSDTVGTPLPGVELRIVEPDAEGVGEVVVRSRTVMRGYLDDPELTRETLDGGWLHTGDLGRLDDRGHLQLRGRRKNMIVTPGGKNIYPEDIEQAFEGLAAKEYCVFAAHYLWPDRPQDERLVLLVHPHPGESLDALRPQIAACNRRLRDYQRVGACLAWPHDFPRTASLKIQRDRLAAAVRAALQREAAVMTL